jgi:hypothetical protein
VALLVILLVLILALSLLLVIPRKSPVTRSPAESDSDDVDYDLLDEAEEELGGLDASVTPEQADDELPDWGPGVPKQRSERAD